MENVAESEDGDSIPGRIEELENEVENLRNENKELREEISVLSDNIGLINWMYIRIKAISGLLEISDEEMKETHHRTENVMKEEGYLIERKNG